ncbi:alpha-taxilin [Phlebotomus papatasi]|uniref:alpha-taxilin n=1 Tax=Phlebotomus papatasi TaxID=29031 RepID=UPI0024841472|nr:alpha-taxilin [Phlebotomus papatasi]XP_055701967.1 alpha-taxilin [Phlebotomus papatasi]XP_055701977.1 alpha-taxilin [Phlebotomus papatasi]
MENSKSDGGDRRDSERKKLAKEERMRDLKVEEQLVKSMSSMEPDDKIHNLVKKYVDLEKETRKLGSVAKQQEKRLDLIQKEKENLQQEYNKAILTKSKLESLCRELQRQNKSIKDESFAKIREEEEKRKETQAKFQKSLNEITTLMNENNERNKKLQEDNVEMSKRLKYLLEQSETREQQVEKINMSIDLSTQLNEAKLTKIQMEAALEKEGLLKEKHEILTDLKRTRQQFAEAQQQLDLYTTKYDEFQNSLSKSNSIFTTYKAELEKMSKKIIKLEKERNEWRTKFEKSNVAVLELASDKQLKDQILNKTTRQLDQLQKLCRFLQADRALLVNTLKENNIERPALPELPPEPEPVEPEPSPQDDKLERMMKTCSEYKQNLAVLQNQLASITKPSTSQESKKSKAKSKKKESQKTLACEMENGDAVVEPVALANSDSAPMSQENTNDTSIIASALPIDQQDIKE